MTKSDGLIFGMIAAGTSTWGNLGASRNIGFDMDFVFKVADRMTVLVEGAVLASGKPSEVRANPSVQTAYLGGHP